MNAWILSAVAAVLVFTSPNLASAQSNGTGNPSGHIKTTPLTQIADLQRSLVSRAESGLKVFRSFRVGCLYGTEEMDLELDQCTCAPVSALGMGRNFVIQQFLGKNYEKHVTNLFQAVVVLQALDHCKSRVDRPTSFTKGLKGLGQAPLISKQEIEAAQPPKVELQGVPAR